MKTVIATLAAAVLSLAALPSYSADEAAPVKSTGAAGAKEPGRTGDPASAEKKKKKAAGGDVKSTGAAGAKEPGRTGDPASAEKK